MPASTESTTSWGTSSIDFWSAWKTIFLMQVLNKLTRGDVLRDS